MTGLLYFSCSPRSVLSLDGPGREPADELLLEHEEQHEQRDGGQHGAGEGDVDGVDLGIAQVLETDLHSAQAVILGDDQGPQVLAEGPEEAEQA